MSLLVLPPWILLESPHSNHPTTTIAVTSIPASRKPTHTAITSSERMATSPCRSSVSGSVPSQGGAPSGPGALGAGPEDPPPGCHWPDLPWLQNAQLCVHPGAGEKKRRSQEIPDLSSSGFLWERQMDPQPLTPPPLWRRAREEQMPRASCLRLPPYLSSHPVLQAPA